MSCRPSHEILFAWYAVTANSLSNTQQPVSIIIQPISLDAVHWVYRAHLDSLKSNTHYRYEIFSIVNKMRVLHGSQSEFFWVGKGGNDTIHFGIISDNQSGLKKFIEILHSLTSLPTSYPLQYGTSFANKVFPHYLIHAGDALQSYHSLEQWQTNFADPVTFAWNNKQMSQPPPIVYAHGNHDHDSQNRYTYTTGPRKGKNWISATLGSAYFVVLDSQPKDQLEVQLEWLDRETRLEAWKNASFRIAIVHIAPFIEYWEPRAWNVLGEKHWGDYVRTKLVPILINQGVDLIISGHQHAYSRGWLPKLLAHDLTDDELTSKMTNSEKQQRWKHILNSRGKRHNAYAKSNYTYSIGQHHEGAMITVIGGAGGQLDFDRVEDWVFYELSLTGRHHYAVITLDNEGSCLTWRAYDVNSQLIDHFNLVRA